MTTPNLSMPELAEGQASGETTHNEALRIIDTVTQLCVLDMNVNTPPAATDGDRYHVGGSPTGAWSGKAGKIAYYAGGWTFTDPKEGWRIYNATTDKLYVYNGSAYRKIPNMSTTLAQLSQSISSPPTQTQVTNIQTALNSLIAMLGADST